MAVLIVLVVLGRGLLAGAGGPGASPSPTPPRDASERPVANGTAGDGTLRDVRIDHVIDGDTLEVRTGGGLRRVRLLGIDAPESTTLRNGHVECGGAEAKAYTRMLADRWDRVDLVTDPRQDAEDRYGRLLAYVEPAGTSGPETFQQELLAAGWARVYVYARDPFSRVPAFRSSAGFAQRAHRGVWMLCGGNFRQPLR